MYVPFDTLSPDSRIWIYQADRLLNPGEVESISEQGKKFVEQWTAHKQTLHAGFEVLHHLFLVVAVDESANDASGCSIDASVKFVRSLEQQFSVKLLNRFAVAYITKEGTVAVMPSDKLADMFRKQEIDQDTMVFNNLISTKNELQSGWKIPFSKSWVMQQVHPG